MIQKIKTTQLKKGMFIHNINCGWLENPFFRSSFPVNDRDTISKILRMNINEVYIDTEKGLAPGEDPIALEEAESVEESVPAVVETQKEPPPMRDESGTDDDDERVSFREEIENARQVRRVACDIVKNVLTDWRLGKQVEMEKVDSAVQDMVTSVFNNRHAILSLTRLKSRDEYTFTHSVNVCVIMVAFCRMLRVEKDTIRQVGAGALLHDIGKMNVSPDILNKKDRLTPAEFMKMKEHVMHGSIILGKSEGITEHALEVATQHHERFDGSGYPLGLKGKEISLFGQMGAIVDVYDAITSDRCYHKGMDPAAALRKLFEWSDRHFSRKLVEVFIKCMGIYPSGSLVRLESGFLAVVLEPGEEDLLKPLVRIIYDTRKQKFVAARDVDLAKGGNGPDRVVAHESPAKWNIIPLEHMDAIPHTA